MIFIKLASILALLSASSHAANVKALAKAIVDRKDKGAPNLLRGGLGDTDITSDAEQGVDKLNESGGISITVDNDDQKCGGAVDYTWDKRGTCQEYLWGPTGDDSMPCFAYGGWNDPCHLNNNNDWFDGRYKDPSRCEEDTFYLWDEPDTQGHDYTWAGRTWLAYSQRFPDQLREMRSRGTKVTGPMLKAGDAGVIGNNMRTFMNACGSACSDQNDPAYIDIIAVNGFCGSWNANCREGAEFIQREAQSISAEHNGLPVYVTNWSRLETELPTDQLEAIECIDAFFSPSSAVKKVYWFGARDYGGGAETTGYLTNVLPDGRTLGQVWREKCDSL